MCKYLFETLLSVLLDNYPEVVILAMAQTVKNLPTVQRPGFDPLVGKISWRREWRRIPVFLPGEFHGHRSQPATVHGVTRSRTRLSDYYVVILLVSF